MVAAAPLAAKMVGDIAQAKQDAADLEAKAYADLAAKAKQAGNDQDEQAYKVKAAEAQADHAKNAVKFLICCGSMMAPGRNPLRVVASPK